MVINIETELGNRGTIKSLNENNYSKKPLIQKVAYTLKSIPQNDNSYGQDITRNPHRTADLAIIS